MRDILSHVIIIKHFPLIAFYKMHCVTVALLVAMQVLLFKPIISCFPLSYRDVHDKRARKPLASRKKTNSLWEAGGLPWKRHGRRTKSECPSWGWHYRKEFSRTSHNIHPLLAPATWGLDSWSDILDSLACNPWLQFTNHCHTQTSVLSVTVSTSRCLAAAFNSGRSLSSVSPSYPRASATSSQRLNRGIKSWKRNRMYWKTSSQNGTSRSWTFSCHVKASSTEVFIYKQEF
jgi:hypothetical protein